jgi:hypothetical protein
MNSVLVYCQSPVTLFPPAPITHRRRTIDIRSFWCSVARYIHLLQVLRILGLQIIYSGRGTECFSVI